MRRRTQAGFAWVSMMDLLFTLFGSLIVLTVLISTKLGAISPIEERRFHALTVEVAAPDRNSGEALVRMNIKFVIFRNGADPCQFGASIRGSSLPEGTRRRPWSRTSAHGVRNRSRGGARLSPCTSDGIAADNGAASGGRAEEPRHHASPGQHRTIARLEGNRRRDRV